MCMWFGGSMRRRRRAQRRRRGAPPAAVAVALLNRARRMWSAARPFMQCVLVHVHWRKQVLAAGRIISAPFEMRMHTLPCLGRCPSRQLSGNPASCQPAPCSPPHRSYGSAPCCSSSATAASEKARLAGCAATHTATCSGGDPSQGTPDDAPHSSRALAASSWPAAALRGA